MLDVSIIVHPAVNHPYICPVSVNLPFATSVYVGFCSALADHGLSEESELTLRNESLIKAWLWGRWMPGMSKWIMPCNTWHQLFCLSGYCCWHKVMHSARDPRWHRMISWDIQAFWSSSPSTSSSAVSLELHHGDSLCFLWNYAVWWGCFTEMDWALFFFDNNVFFPCQWFSLSRKKFKSKSRTQHYKRDLHKLPVCFSVLTTSYHVSFSH